MMLEGDVLAIEGECKSLRVGLIVVGDFTILHGSLKVLGKSRHPSSNESIKESKERRDLILVVL